MASTIAPSDLQLETIQSSHPPSSCNIVLTRGIDFVRLVYARFGLPADDEVNEDDPIWELCANIPMMMQTPSESAPVQGVPGAFLVSNVFNQAECEALISAVEQMGFTHGTGR